MAYSSIAHGGYLLIGLIVALTAIRSHDATNSDTANLATAGMGAALFYVAIYSIASAGVFAGLAYLGNGDREIETVDDLAGVAKREPVVAAMLAVLLFSLAGIPPLVGFWGKLALFTGPLEVYMSGNRMLEAGEGDAALTAVAIGKWHLALAVIGVLNAAAAAGYYLRLIAAMYFRPAEQTMPADGGRGAFAAAAICAVAVLLGGAFPAIGLEYAQRAGSAALAEFRSNAVSIDAVSVDLNAQTMKTPALQTAMRRD